MFWTLFQILQPYGKGYVQLNDRLIKNRLQNYNCQFFRKPGLAYSTFAGSVYQNFEEVKGKLENITREHRKKAKCIEKLKPHFDTINRNIGLTDSSSKDVEVSLKFITEILCVLDGRWFSRFMLNMYEVGACMYQMSLHWLVTSAIFHDPEFLADKLSPTNATKDFIKSKKLKDYTKIALKELRGCETSPRKVSSISLDSSSDEDNDNIFVTPKGRKGLASTKINSSSSEESENELSLEVARVISTPKKRKCEDTSTITKKLNMDSI